LALIAAGGFQGDQLDRLLAEALEQEFEAGSIVADGKGDAGGAEVAVELSFADVDTEDDGILHGVVS